MTDQIIVEDLNILDRIVKLIADPNLEFKDLAFHIPMRNMPEGLNENTLILIERKMA